MIPKSLAAMIAAKVKAGDGDQDTKKDLKSQARKAAIKKLMAALKSDDEDKALCALDDLKDIDQE